MVAEDGKSLVKGDRGHYELWTPIGSRFSVTDNAFNGTFDGCGHTIKGLVCIEDGKRSSYGLFGCTDNATIKNLNMEDCCLDFQMTEDTYEGTTNGILSGNSYKSTFLNCHVYNSFVLYYARYGYVGGLIGCVDVATFKSGKLYIDK